MLRYLPVRRIHARQVLDSRGTPTVEVEATVGEGIIGIEGYTARAIVPSGASTGRFEAVELRDGEKGYYVGLSVRKAVENVNIRLAEAILGENALNQVRIDELLIKADGTENKSVPGQMQLWAFPWRLPGQRRWRFGFRFISILAAAIQEKCRFR